MSHKSQIEMIAMTPQQMFDMIESFADGLLDHIRQVTPEDFDPEEFCSMAESLLTTMKDKEIEGRVGIVILLHTAVAMYKTALDNRQWVGSGSPCHLVN